MEYDDLIRETVAKYFPDCPDWLLIKAQVWAESEFNPHAVSPCGAQGLMQLMPATAKELGVIDSFDPGQNLRGGCLFMRDLFRDYAEIPNPTERMKFAQAAFNGGRGNINPALSLARKSEGLPSNFIEWFNDGKPSGKWQTWDYTQGFLAHCEACLNPIHCDVKQIRDYVAKISEKYQEYLEGA